jgi:hypothetical protein
MHSTGVKIIGNTPFICLLCINFLFMIYLKILSMPHAIRRRIAKLENAKSKATVVSLSLHLIICHSAMISGLQVDI